MQSMDDEAIQARVHRCASDISSGAMHAVSDLESQFRTLRVPVESGDLDSYAWPYYAIQAAVEAKRLKLVQHLLATCHDTMSPYMYEQSTGDECCMVIDWLAYTLLDSRCDFEQAAPLFAWMVETIPWTRQQNLHLPALVACPPFLHTLILYAHNSDICNVLDDILALDEFIPHCRALLPVARQVHQTPKEVRRLNLTASAILLDLPGKVLDSLFFFDPEAMHLPCAEFPPLATPFMLIVMAIGTGRGLERYSRALCNLKNQNAITRRNFVKVGGWRIIGPALAAGDVNLLEKLSGVIDWAFRRKDGQTYLHDFARCVSPKHFEACLPILEHMAVHGLDMSTTDSAGNTPGCNATSLMRYALNAFFAARA